MQEAEYTPEMIREVDRKIPLGRQAWPEEMAVRLLVDWHVRNDCQ